MVNRYRVNTDGFGIEEVKEMTVPEMMRHNDKLFADDFISERWQNRKWLYAFVLSHVVENGSKDFYPRSYGSPKVSLELQPLLEKVQK